MKVALTVIKGPRPGRVLEFTEPRGFFIGRADDNDFQLSPEDPYVSGRHAYLEICPPSCRLRDLDSTNGTAVNGQRVTECDLKDSDLIEFGFTQLKVAISTEIAQLTRNCSRCGQLIEYLPDEPEPEHCSACAEVEQRSVRVGPAQIWVTCGSCQRDMTEQANSDGRAEELRGIAVYTCEKCLPVRDEGAGGLIGDYEVLRLLGDGGMGAVYLVYHRPTARLWALKQMKDLRDPLLVKRFEREIRLMKDLSHRNVVQFTDTGVNSDGKPYIVTEYIPAGCLEDAVLANGGRLEASCAVSLIHDVLDGLEYIHGQSIIHRDIKPPNILLHQELHTEPTHIRPKLADFGLAVSYARAGGTRFTKPKTYMGSLMYSSPEQVRDLRTVKETGDIYSLGVTLYYLLTGQYTFNFPTPAEVIEFKNKWGKWKSLEDALRALMKLRQIMHPFNIILSEEPVPIRKRDPSIPRELAEVVDRAVRKDSKARFQSAGEFRSALQQAMGR